MHIPIFRFRPTNFFLNQPMHGSRALIGGLHVHIFRFCPINSFEINLISKELVGQNLNI